MSDERIELAELVDRGYDELKKLLPDGVPVQSQDILQMLVTSYIVYSYAGSLVVMYKIMPVDMFHSMMQRLEETVTSQLEYLGEDTHVVRKN